MGAQNPKVDAFVSRTKRWQDETQKLRSILLDGLTNRGALPDTNEKPALGSPQVAGFVERNGGADETRTRDLRRDRPAF